MHTPLTVNWAFPEVMHCYEFKPFLDTQKTMKCMKHISCLWRKCGEPLCDDTADLELQFGSSHCPHKSGTDQVYSERLFEVECVFSCTQIW